MQHDVALRSARTAADRRAGQPRATRAVNEALGLLLGLGIGAACRWFDLPVPAPPRVIGALLVVSMTLGFLAADRFLA